MNGRLSSAGRMSGALSPTQCMSGEMVAPHGGVPYTGRYTFEPTEEEQTVETQGATLAQNIIIEPIPTNYAKMTWHGSVLMLS